MVRRDRAARRLRAALLPLLPWLALACQSPGRTSTAAGLAEGPTRWLMLPDELRQVQRVRTNREAVEWLEEFWRRRDPDPEQPGNEAARTFYQRVEAADRLYPESGLRGSLTPRGRALILLGPPPVLRYGQKRVPVWEPGRLGARPGIQTRHVILESWVFALDDLAPRLRERLAREEPETPEVVLVFLVEPRRTELVEGGRFLEAAVRAAVRDDGGPKGAPPGS